MQPHTHIHTPGNTEEIVAASVKPSYKTSLTRLITAANNYSEDEGIQEFTIFSSTLFASTGFMPNVADTLAITLAGTKDITMH